MNIQTGAEITGLDPNPIRQRVMERKNRTIEKIEGKIEELRQRKNKIIEDVNTAVKKRERDAAAGIDIDLPEVDVPRLMSDAEFQRIEDCNVAIHKLNLALRNELLVFLEGEIKVDEENLKKIELKHHEELAKLEGLANSVTESKIALGALRSWRNSVEKSNPQYNPVNSVDWHDRLNRQKAAIQY